MNLLAEPLLPTVAERVARALGDLRMGLPCGLTHGAVHGMCLSVERLSPARFDALRDRFGAPELILTAERARALSIQPPEGAGLVRIQPPEQAGLDWFQGLADAGQDGVRGPTGPLHLIRSGDTALQQMALTLTKRAELLPAALVFPVQDRGAVDGMGLTSLRVEEATGHFRQFPDLPPVAAARLPLESHAVSRLQVFSDPTGRTEHYAIEIGHPDPAQAVLTRLHSACFTGDVLGSLKCDCGPQLHAALDQMGREGAGVLLYMNQEGRGIGLANKMRVYDLQSQGLDTVEANHHLGFRDDERDFRMAAVMLQALGYRRIRLLTNNPVKVQAFEAHGIGIAQHLPLRVGRNRHNDRYLSVKALKSGHML